MRTTSSGTAASNRQGTVNFSHRQPKWMAWLCLATLVTATIVQATHFCGFRILDTSNTVQFRAISPSGTLCLTCLMAQLATAAVLFVACFSNLRVRSHVTFRGTSPRPLLEFFQLHVRPP